MMIISLKENAHFFMIINVRQQCMHLNAKLTFKSLRAIMSYLMLKFQFNMISLNWKKSLFNKRHGLFP